jgi:hypothetical protein
LYTRLTVDQYKKGYLNALGRVHGFGGNGKAELVVPAGPLPDILPLDDDDK